MVGTNDTVAQSELQSALTRMIPAEGTSPTLVDDAFLESTAQDMLGAEPRAALLHEEQARTKRVAPLMVVIGLIAMGTVPLFGGTLWAKTLLYTTLVLGVSSMAWLWWLASQARPVPLWQSTLAYGSAFSAACANSVFFGIYSPAPMLMALSVVIFAQGHSLNLARGACVAASATQLGVALLDAFGIAQDPGIVQAQGLTVFERVAGQMLVQTLLVTAYLLGRFARKASSEAFSQNQQAMRELARREAVVLEARLDKRRALNIGGTGRLSGETFGSYRLAELIGHGGMGEVYCAEHLTLGTKAAVKVIHPHLCHTEGVLERFLREAELSVCLDSPHIVRVLGTGNSSAGPYIAMELLEGHDLASHFQVSDLLSLQQLVELAAQVGSGLDAAATASVVHRDIKPQNIFLVGDTDTGPSAKLDCKILDFGVARAMSSSATPTVGDSILGTPNYMSPEQATGHVTDHRSDLYALMALLYRSCTGFVPFDGENAQAVLYAVVHSMPRPASTLANVPEALDAVFTKGFAKNPDDRYQSGKELSDAVAAACAQ